MPDMSDKTTSTVEPDNNSPAETHTLPASLNKGEGTTNGQITLHVPSDGVITPVYEVSCSFQR
jgi:hypothetical protein